MSWNEVSPTLTTQCTGLGMEDLDTLNKTEQFHCVKQRSCNHFQKNINSSILKRMKSFNRRKTHWHAVPPRLGFVIAKSIRKHLIQNYVS